MYIFGGKKSAFENTNSMYAFDFTERQWSLIEPKDKSKVPPPIDSFNYVLYEKNEKEIYFLIFGGYFGGSIGKYSNSIYAYNILENQWEILFQPQKPKGTNIYPKKRSNSGIAIWNNKLYVFGGTNGKIKMSDLWTFDLEKRSWEKIVPKENIIEVQNAF